MLSDATQGFQLIRKLGDGSFGLVQLCRDLQLDRYVAIKTLISGNSELTLPQQQQLLQHEARRMDRLKHSRVAVVYQFLMWQGRPAFVMEYLAGGTLREHVCGGNRGESEAVRLMRQVAEGLCHVHRQSEVHLDLSPNNILLTDSGDAKISDFALPLPGMQGGTGGYKAPERYQGCADARSDVYSFGGCLYFAITGQHPPARQTLPDFSAGRFVKRVVLRCMQPDPRERYRDGCELVAALSEAAPALPAVVPPTINRDKKTGHALFFNWNSSAVRNRDLNEIARFTGNREACLRDMHHLKTLRLTGTGISNQALEEISGLPALRVLHLSKTEITDDGLKHITCMQTLEELSLSGCAISDQSLVHICRLPALQILKLGETRVTDAALQIIAEMKNLQEVSLGATRITDDGRLHLAMLRPKLRILER